MSESERRTSPLLVAAAWVVVLIPLVWGVSQSVRKSLPLFEFPPTAWATAAPR